jgi:hypothetical protein
VLSAFSVLSEPAGSAIAGQLASVVRLRLNGAKHRGAEERGYVLIQEVADQICRAFYSRSPQGLLHAARCSAAHGVVEF